MSILFLQLLRPKTLEASWLFFLIPDKYRRCCHLFSEYIPSLIIYWQFHSCLNPSHHCHLSDYAVAPILVYFVVIYSAFPLQFIFHTSIWVIISKHRSDGISSLLIILQRSHLTQNQKSLLCFKMPYISSHKTLFSMAIFQPHGSPRSWHWADATY